MNAGVFESSASRVIQVHILTASIRNGDHDPGPTLRIFQGFFAVFIQVDRLPVFGFVNTLLPYTVFMNQILDNGPVLVDYHGIDKNVSRYRVLV